MHIDKMQQGMLLPHVIKERQMKTDRIKEHWIHFYYKIWPITNRGRRSLETDRLFWQLQLHWSVQLGFKRLLPHRHAWVNDSRLLLHVSLKCSIRSGFTEKEARAPSLPKWPATLHWSPIMHQNLVGDGGIKEELKSATRVVTSQFCTEVTINRAFHSDKTLPGPDSGSRVNHVELETESWFFIQS